MSPNRYNNNTQQQREVRIKKKKVLYGKFFDGTYMYMMYGESSKIDETAKNEKLNCFPYLMAQFKTRKDFQKEEEKRSSLRKVF
jgi:hypothetical protein